MATGTISGAEAGSEGSLIELYRNERFLADGDEVVLSGSAPGVGGGIIALGDVAGRISPAAHPG
jgi:fumarylacetoacetase